MADDKRGFSVYLLRPAAQNDFERTLMAKAAGAIPLVAPLDGSFRMFPADQKEPSWVGVVRALLPVKTLDEMLSGIPGGLLYMKRPGGNFVVAFGLAWTRLKNKWLEADFGKRVALNSIAKDHILEIRAEQVFAKWHIANERSPRATQVEEFALDPSRDVVASIEGVSSDVAAGAPIRGATSLRVNTSMADLPEELDKAAKLFKSDAYTKKWPEIDNIIPVSDASTEASLDVQLDAALGKSTVNSNFALFSPSFRHAESLDEKWYCYGKRAGHIVTYPSLRFRDWFSILKEKRLTPSVNEARNCIVHLLDENKDPQQRTTLYDCLSFEASYASRPYILSAGRWYEVVPQFLQRTKQALGAIPSLQSGLPKYELHHSEPFYNKMCESLPGMLHFDAKSVRYGGGQSKFEFCDFMHPGQQTLFFAKNCSRSAGMSHLIEQVRRTCELLFNTDPGFREALYDMYKKATSASQAQWLKSRPKNAEWKICLVSLGRSKDELPFFAKCSLVNLHKYLTERDHTAYFIKV